MSVVLAASCPTEFAARVEAFQRIADTTTRGIGNLDTRIEFLGEGQTRVPASVNVSEPGNTWVCSPHTTYARYTIEELQRFGHPLLTGPLSVVCRLLGEYLWNSRIDHAVAINNWLVSTNLYPPLDSVNPSRWIDESVGRWPGLAVWFRSLNARYTPDWLRALTQAGCTLIPSRQVYLYDHIDPAARRPRNLYRDFALLNATYLKASEAADWNAADFSRAAELYGLLYLQKYSTLNPSYGQELLRAWAGAGLLELTGYRDSAGTLQGVVGVFALGAVITAPIVGYNTSLPQQIGLYRLLMATVYKRAARAGQAINLSAGAAAFKRSRGGIGTMEYSAVYTRHLPMRQRRALAVLGSLTRGLGEPIMRRFQL